MAYPGSLTTGEIVLYDGHSLVSWQGRGVEGEAVLGEVVLATAVGRGEGNDLRPLVRLKASHCALSQAATVRRCFTSPSPALRGFTEQGTIAAGSRLQPRQGVRLAGHPPEGRRQGTDGGALGAESRRARKGCTASGQVACGKRETGRPADAGGGRGRKERGEGSSPVSVPIFPGYQQKPVCTVAAHEGALAAIAFNALGSKLASASEKVSSRALCPWGCLVKAPQEGSPRAVDLSRRDHRQD